VYFNDSTKAVLAPAGENFMYIERTRQRSGNESHEQISEHYTLTEFPSSLQKKVTLLKHFKNYLMEQVKKDRDDNEIQIQSSPSGGRDITYLSKWVRTKHAILFRLSDNTVQVVFYDNTEIIISSNGSLVTSVDKDRYRTTYFVESVTSNPYHADIKKRLKYARDMIQQLTSGNKKN